MAWTIQGKDTKAAKRQYDEILSSLSLLDKEKRKEAMRLFTIAFLEAYKETRTLFSQLTKSKELDKPNQLHNGIIASLKATKEQVLRYKKEQDENDPYILGTALGKFLATINPGIISPCFTYEDHKKELNVLFRIICVSLRMSHPYVTWWVFISRLEEIRKNNTPSVFASRESKLHIIGNLMAIEYIKEQLKR